eukprot:TRINITY_DN6529_c0_g1_i3.p1 TRINITY_DN6529_c0_g1~~TRINITY_DN6529_c0_g1_i3.p1  ORF type:complete len:205 (-),score=34.36 TRINITY_DN6529_c0_g1_i3:521-1135(-)
MQSPVNNDMSLYHFLKEKGYSQYALALADLLVAQPNCVRLDQLSVKDLIREAKYDHSGKGESRILEGYSELWKRYAQVLGSNILLGQNVVDISWIENSHVILTTSAGQVYKAKKAILTIPIAVLQAGHVTFRPELPHKTRDAINSLYMRAATKILYIFDKLFWSNNMIYLVSTGKHMIRLVTTFVTLQPPFEMCTGGGHLGTVV